MANRETLFFASISVPHPPLLRGISTLKKSSARSVFGKTDRASDSSSPTGEHFTTFFIFPLDNMPGLLYTHATRYSGVDADNDC